MVDGCWSVLDEGQMLCGWDVVPAYNSSKGMSMNKCHIHLLCKNYGSGWWREVLQIHSFVVMVVAASQSFVKHTEMRKGQLFNLPAS